MSVNIAAEKPLTDRAVQALEIPQDKPYKKADKAVPGLYIYVTPSGSKLWRLKYRLGAKEGLLALGPFPEVTVNMARDAAIDHRRQIRAGIDPAVKEKAPGGPGFGEVAAQWAAQTLVEPQKSPSTIKRDRINLEKHILPALGGIPIKEVKAQTLLGFLQPIVARGHFETVSRVRIICNQIFKFAICLGLIDRNPAQDIIGALPTGPDNHYATITKPAEVRELLRKIWGYPGYVVAGLALRMLAYVFTRPGELRQARWEEIDWEDRLWRIPAERMKMRREHLVPLATQVVGLLKELRAYAGESPWVLPGYHTAEQCLSEGTFKHSLKALGYSSTVITAHGFRSMASTILNERGYNPDWIEAQLAHKDSNSIRAIYNRALYLPERRQMMQEWADYLDALRQGEGE